MQIKKNGSTKEAGWLSIKLAIITTLCVIVMGAAVQADCTYSAVAGQACSAKPETYGGSCSGTCTAQPPTCGGGKTDTLYNGCNQCTSSTAENASCNTISGSCSDSDCGYKTRTASCACIGSACDVPANAWPQWPNIWSDSPNGNSCK